MPFRNLRSRRFMQMCWVVPDIQTAMQSWLRTTGVGPFFLFDQVGFENPVYRGQPSHSPDITAAMAQAGEVQIELVSQRDDKPSIWRDVVPAGQSGLHHMALYSSDYEADLAAYTRESIQVAFSGLMMGSRVCWLDTTRDLGFMIELIEANDVARSVFAQFEEAARNWDGSRPIRTLS